MNIEESIEKIKRQITIGECEKNIGIPVYISDLKAVLEELENKQDDINILQAQRDSMEYQFKQAVLTLEHKDQIINLMALAILNYDDQLVINKYKDINDVKETFEEILKEDQ